MSLFNDEEREAMRLTTELVKVIAVDWELEKNTTEFYAALHTVQGYILQHAAAREFPSECGSWWRATAPL